MDQAKGVRYEVVQVRTQEPDSDFHLAEYRVLRGWAIYDKERESLLNDRLLSLEVAEEICETLTQIDDFASKGLKN